MPEANSRKIVLVVEDNPLNMKLVADLLKLHDFDVIKTADGEGALNILKDKIPHLILLDIQLPGMDGLEVFRRIRADKSLDGVKVIAMTAYAMKEDEKKIKEMGFDVYISKPIDPKDSIEKIKGVLSCGLK